MARKKTTSQSQPTAPHAWRLCPAGEHWVATHPMRVPPSKVHPAGSVTIYLEREASWEEAVMNYKGKLKSKPDNPDALKQKKIFQKYFDKLEKCEKS